MIVPSNSLQSPFVLVRASTPHCGQVRPALDGPLFFGMGLTNRAQVFEVAPGKKKV